MRAARKSRTMTRARLAADWDRARERGPSNGIAAVEALPLSLRIDHMGGW
jgi:hypothetical protein